MCFIPFALGEACERNISRPRISSLTAGSERTYFHVASSSTLQKSRNPFYTRIRAGIVECRGIQKQSSTIFIASLVNWNREFSSYIVFVFFCVAPLRGSMDSKCPFARPVPYTTIQVWSENNFTSDAFISIIAVRLIGFYLHRRIESNRAMTSPCGVLV